MRRRAVIFALCSGAALAATAALRPSHRASDQLARIDLEAQVPRSFAGWSIDTSITPILPNPEVQAKLDQIYTQVLARTYINGNGQRVMLSIAYGADQGSDATAVHRPEFCYSAQGFAVRGLGDDRISINTHQLNVRRLVGRLGPRHEPITYWLTINDQSSLPGIERKLKQIRFGLMGLIPDGMLVRVSNIDSNQTLAFAVHDRFVSDLEENLSSELKARYFGVRT